MLSDGIFVSDISLVQNIGNAGGAGNSTVPQKNDLEVAKRHYHVKECVNDHMFLLLLEFISTKVVVAQKKELEAAKRHYSCEEVLK